MFRSCVLVLAVLLGPGLSKSGTLIHEELATISEVRLVVLMGGLRHDPLPGFRPESFQQEVHRQASRELKACGLEAREESAQQLFLRFRKDRDEKSDRFVAISIDVQLAEPATLTRRWAKHDLKPESSVVTWETQALLLADPGTAVDKAIDTVTTQVRHFAQDALKARFFREHGHSPASSPQAEAQEAECMSRF